MLITDADGVGQVLGEVVGGGQGGRGRWWAGASIRPDTAKDPRSGPVPAPSAHLPSAALSPLLPPQQMMTSWGRQFLIKHHPSCTTHRVPRWVPLARPHFILTPLCDPPRDEGEALSLICPLAGGGMGTSWDGLGVQRPLQTPLCRGPCPPLLSPSSHRPHGTPRRRPAPGGRLGAHKGLGSLP